MAALFLAMLLASVARAQTTDTTAMKPGQTAQKFHLERTQVLDADYLLFLPNGYGADASRRWPLILFLHGAGERGSDVWKVAKHGPPKIDTTATNFPFIVVSPQCPDGQMWSDEMALALLDMVMQKYPVDNHRVYLTGLSMGGYGAWSLGLKHPERFAAIAPICGGGETIPIILARDFDAAQMQKIKTLGIWAFHGGKDPTVPTEESAHMINALKQAGCTDVKLTIYPDALHDSWTQTYLNPELFEWFLKHSR
jgi:predicted peptidase